MNYVLYGEEHSLLQQTLSRLMREHGDGDILNSVTYDLANQTLYDVLDDVQTIPFFGEQKVVVVMHADFLSGSGELIDGVDGLERYLLDPLATSSLILVCDYPKLDSRKKIVKTIQKTCKVLSFAKLDELGKQSFIREQLNKRNIQLDAAAGNELVKRLTNDVGEMRQAMDKLELWFGPIKKEDVQALVMRPLDDNVFELVNAVLARNTAQAFRLWRDLASLNKDAIYLIAILAGQLRFFYQVKTLYMQGNNEREITQQLGAHPFRVKKSLSSVMDVDVATLMRLLSSLADLDQKIKSGRVDKDTGFELFLLHM